MSTSPDPTKIIKFSYSGDPSSSNRDAVRFLVGDTDKCEPQLDDREIDFLLIQDGNPISAAACAADALAAKYARQVDNDSGSNSDSASQRSTAYLALAAELRRKLGRRAVAPFCGGISVADKQTRENDSDRVAPSFTRDMNDNPSSGVTDNQSEDLP